MINFTSQYELNSVDVGDKSISHRALILASVACGTSVIRNLSLCQDVLTTVDCLRALGARVELCGTTATVYPITKPCNNVILNCRNSGTTARLLCGLVAGLQVNATFYGDESLTNRPMLRVLQPLAEMGARYELVDGALFKILPSPLHGANITAQCNSAQVKSAVLIAGLFAEGQTSYTEVVATRNHTENLLHYLGANIAVHGNSITVSKSVLNAFDVTIPNDFSSAAYLLALALLSGQNFTYPNLCVNKFRTGFLRVLERSGAHFILSNERTCFGEPIADVTVLQRGNSIQTGTFRAIQANLQDVTDMIDEVPLCAALALTVKGTHQFCGVLELQYKESNRLEAIMEMAQILGQKAQLQGENLVVTSNGILPTHPQFDAKHDHRISMCQSVLSLGCCGGGSVINENFDVSFPDFLQAVGVTPLRLALVGERISGSLSPLLMRNLATHANVCCTYNLFPLPADVCDQTLLDTLQNVDGANVTMPFKNRVAQLLSAQLTSVNTVGKHVAPTSTDGYGLLEALISNNVEFTNAPLWVIGAGGAAEACVQTLLQYGCKIQILNRTLQHAEALTKKYNLATNLTNPIGVLSFVPSCQFEADVVLPQSVRFVFVADYKHPSGLEAQAKSRGIKFISGLQMLYHQGAKSFALWTGTEIQTDYDSFSKEIGK